ncbi:MAG: hypothetical protein AAF799_29775 [Myxococcota bacterium]
MPTKIHTTPRLTFSSLAKLMAPHTPMAQQTILTGHKYPRSGPMLGYVNALHHLVGLLKNGKPGGRALRPHEQAVVNAFKAQPFKLPKGVKVLKQRPNAKQKYWHYHGVDISVFPDVLLDGPKGKGALKLYPNQEPLARGVGKTMATLLHHYMTSVNPAGQAHPSYCLVYEIRKGKFHRAGTGNATANALKRAQVACGMAAAVWPTL